MAYIRCWTCNGNGIDDKSKPCQACRGTGADVEKTKKLPSCDEPRIPHPLQGKPHFDHVDKWSHP
jgi:hypothetical protein